MRRTRKRFIRISAGFAAISILASPIAAYAFHVGSVFDKPPGAGGGGGLYYTGAPFDKGWTCGLCHLDAPGKIKLRLQVQPAELFQSFTLSPGQTYTFTATMEGESKGLGSSLSNYNTMAVSITDSQGVSIGSIGGFAPEDFYAANPSTIISTGQKPGMTGWTFSYTAPADMKGPVSMYVAAVDGNGADSPPTKTLTDPFGDDVFTAAVHFNSGATAQISAPKPSGSHFISILLAPFAAAAAAIVQRNRKRQNR